MDDDRNWTDPECPVARTLDLVGDRWSLLVIRDAMDGAQAFGDFQRRTGIARNILADRLRKLTERGVLERRPGPTGKRPVYLLTRAGSDLFATVVALRQWGERHAFAEGETHSTLVDPEGRALPVLVPVDAAGDPLAADRARVVRAGA